MYHKWSLPCLQSCLGMHDRLVASLILNRPVRLHQLFDWPVRLRQLSDWPVRLLQLSDRPVRYSLRNFVGERCTFQFWCHSIDGRSFVSVCTRYCTNIHCLHLLVLIFHNSWIWLSCDQMVVIQTEINPEWPRPIAVVMTWLFVCSQRWFLWWWKFFFKTRSGRCLWYDKTKSPFSACSMLSPMKRATASAYYGYHQFDMS